MRNWFKRVADSPGVQGLFASFIAFAGLVLMAQAAWSVWQTFGVAAPPADVRVLDADDVGYAEALASLPTDVTVVDEALEASVTRLRLEAAAVGSPVVRATQPALTSAPVMSVASPTPTRAVVAVATDVATVYPTGTADPRSTISARATPAAAELDAPEFAWESDLDSDDMAVVEVVEAKRTHLSTTKLDRPTRLVIPSIRVDSPVVDVNLVIRVRRGRTVSMWQVARDAVGFHSSSALPGTLGNAVMSAHNNAWGRVFRNLIHIKRGDEVKVYVGGRVLRYVIEDKLLVRQSRASATLRKRNAAWIGPTADERLTLVSCWPYRRPTHRVIVVARPVSPTKSAAGG